MQLFISNEHEKKFEELCKRDKTDIKDINRRALFFVIAGDYLLFEHVDLLYDFEDHEIRMEIYNQPFLSGEKRCLIDLAFHLYGSEAECEIRFLFFSLNYIKSLLALNAIRYFHHMIHFNGDRVLVLR